MKWLSLSLAAVVVSAAATGAQVPDDRTGAGAQAERVNERMRTLQIEADRLAGEARTLIGDLRTLEVERDIQIERVNKAQAAAEEGRVAVAEMVERLATLEARRIAQLPDIEVQLVDLYKRGRGGYARMLFGSASVREFGRTTRAVAAMVRISEERLAEHQRTLEALRQERAALETRARELEASEADARRARAAADRTVAARAALIRQIDARRDLNAQLAGELLVAYQRLQEQMASLAAGRPVEPVAVPLAPFRGALDWPVAGTLTSRFGQPSGRPGDTTVRNGVEIAAAEGASVQAVHSGTVSYADPFAGFGNLVILDHGASSYTLYGFLASSRVREGEAVEAGAEIGRVGSPPAGPPSLYFEIRVDGRSADPVQWLEPR